MGIAVVRLKSRDRPSQVSAPKARAWYWELNLGGANLWHRAVKARLPGALFSEVEDQVHFVGLRMPLPPTPRILGIIVVVGQ